VNNEVVEKGLEERAEELCRKKLATYCLELEAAEAQVRILTDLKCHLQSKSDELIFNRSWLSPATKRLAEAKSKSSFWEDKHAVMLWLSRKDDGTE